MTTNADNPAMTTNGVTPDELDDLRATLARVEAVLSRYAELHMAHPNDTTIAAFVFDLDRAIKGENTDA